MFKIDEGGGDEAGQENGVDNGDGQRRERMGLVTELEPASEESDAGEEFDHKIADGNGCATIPAFTVEPKPGDERDIEVERDGIVAMRAMRRRRDDAEA